MAIGLRGPGRNRRHGTEVDLASVRTIVTPEQLAVADSSSINHLMLRRALDRLAGVAPAWSGHRSWGPVGAVGYQLTTGLPVIHDASDLDLVIRTEEPVDRAEARVIAAKLSVLPCRCDCLLETPAGAISLLEWASGRSDQVLLRTSSGPRLSANPWVLVQPDQSAL